MSDKHNPVSGFRYLPETEENGPLAKYEIGEMVHKTVRIMDCFYRGDNGFFIYGVEENCRRFTITGSFPYDFVMNGYYVVSGTVALDRKGKRQLKIIECESTLPIDKDGIIAVLQTLHGLDIRAYKLYDAIGPRVLELLKTNPEAIVGKVKGIGLKRAKGWQMELLSREGGDRELRKLYGMGITPQQATRLVTEFGIGICDEVAQNPYCLMGKVRGYGFKKCDKLALEGGMSVRSPERLKKGILFVLETIEGRGHCTYPKAAFFQTLHSGLDITINQSTALKILSTPGGKGTIDYAVGASVYRIQLEELAIYMNNWKNNFSCKKERFAFPIDAIEDSLLEDAMKELQDENMIICESVGKDEYITTMDFYRAEKDIVTAINNFRLNERDQFSGLQMTIEKTLNGQGVILEQKQKEAVERICRATGGIFILNGSAGCGKTFTLNIIMRVLKELDKSFNPCILAPTGKAAKVVAKATGLEAKTIHKALELVSAAETINMYGGRTVVNNNCIVVDEFSMVDEILCAKLFQGISQNAKVILLGDVEQLPSVRAGSVLKDLVTSGLVPVLTLDVVKRQNSQSGILINANKIIRGEAITSIVANPNTMRGNAYIRSAASAINAQKEIVKLAKKCGLESFQSGNVQVLCPLKAGPAGTEMLNYLLQQELNPRPKGEELEVGKIYIKGDFEKEKSYPKSFRIGDCVIHIKNDYNRGWFEKHPINGFIPMGKSGVVNGDTGIVDSIDVFTDEHKQSHRILYVNYDGHYIAYDNEFDELSLAYALTIHKSQGSQWPLVICPIIQPTMLLNRKLLYTMYTRAQESNILIGRGELIWAAIKNTKEDRRMTLLQQRLKGDL